MHQYPETLFRFTFILVVREQTSVGQFSFANVFNVADGKEGSLKTSKHSSCS